MKERPTYELCSEIQQHLRRLAFFGDADNSSFYTVPFFDMTWAAEWRRRHAHAFVVPPLPKEPPVALRPVVTEHIVKKHVFSDGTIWESCSATGCEYATSSTGDRAEIKRHTDRAIGIYAIDDEIETKHADDPEELSLEETQTVVAGEDQPEEIDDYMVVQEDEAQTVSCVEGDE